jgi:hypothetical protein
VVLILGFIKTPISLGHVHSAWHGCLLIAFIIGKVQNESEVKNLVYKVKRKICSQMYVGETNRRAYDRLGELYASKFRI